MTKKQLYKKLEQKTADNIHLLLTVQALRKALIHQIRKSKNKK